MRQRGFFLLLCALAASCASDREGWARRGRYSVLRESALIQARRGPQVLDARSGELVITWVGARTPAGQPELSSCELTVFDDLDGDGAPAPGEIRAVRASSERARKVLFEEVRARISGAKDLRAVLVASTGRERCAVRWRPAPD